MIDSILGPWFRLQGLSTITKVADCIDELQTELGKAKAEIAKIIDRVGEFTDGRPVNSDNLLERLDELRRIEKDRDKLTEIIRFGR